MASHQSRPSHKRRLEVPEDSPLDTAASSFSSSLSPMSSSVWKSSKIGTPSRSPPRPKGVAFAKKQLDDGNDNHDSLEHVMVVSEDADDEVSCNETDITTIECNDEWDDPKSTSIHQTIHQDEDSDDTDNEEETDDCLYGLLVPPQPGNVVPCQEHEAAMTALNQKRNDALTKALSESEQVLTIHGHVATPEKKELDEATVCVAVTEQRRDELLLEEVEVSEQKLENATEPIVENDEKSLKTFYEARMMDLKVAYELQKSKDMEWSQRTIDEIRQKADEARARDLEEARLQHEVEKERALAVQRKELMQLVDEDKIQILIEQSDQETTAAMEGTKMECQQEYDARIEAVRTEERQWADDDKNRALESYKIQIDEERSRAINDAIVKFEEARNMLCTQHKEELRCLSQQNDEKLSQVEAEYQDMFSSLQIEHIGEFQEERLQHSFEMNEALSKQREHYESQLVKLSNELEQTSLELENQKIDFEAQQVKAVNEAVEKAVQISIGNAEREREAAFTVNLEMADNCRLAFEKEKEMAVKEATMLLEEQLRDERKQIHQLVEDCNEKDSEISLLKRQHQDELQALELAAKQRKEELEQIFRHELNLVHIEKDAAIVESTDVAASITREATAMLKTMEAQVSELRSSCEQDTEATVVAACALLFQGMTTQLQAAARLQIQYDETDAAYKCELRKNEELVNEIQEIQQHHAMTCLEYEGKIEMLGREFELQLASQEQLGEQTRATLTDAHQLELSKTRQELDDVLQQANVKFENDKGEMRKEHEKILLEYDEKIETLVRQFDSQLAHEIRLVEQNNAKQGEDHQRELSKSRQELDDVLQANTKFENEIAEIQQQHEKLRRDYEEKIEALVGEFEMQLAHQRLLREQEKTNHEEAHRLELSNIRKELDDLLQHTLDDASESRRFQTEILKLKSDKDNEIGELKDLALKERIRLEEEFLRDLELMQRANEAALSDRDVIIQQAVSQAILDNTQKLTNEHQLELKSRLNEAAAEHEEEVRTIKVDADAKLQNLMSRHEHEIENLVVSHNEAIEVQQEEALAATVAIFRMLRLEYQRQTEVAIEEAMPEEAETTLMSEAPTVDPEGKIQHQANEAVLSERDVTIQQVVNQAIFDITEKLKDEHQRELESRLTEMTSEHEEEVRAIKVDADEELQNLISRHEHKILELRQTFAANDAMTEMRASINQSYATALAETKNELSYEIENLVISHNEALEVQREEALAATVAIFRMLRLEYQRQMEVAILQTMPEVVETTLTKEIPTVDLEEKIQCQASNYKLEIEETMKVKEEEMNVLREKHRLELSKLMLVLDVLTIALKNMSNSIETQSDDHVAGITHVELDTFERATVAPCNDNSSGPGGPARTGVRRDEQDAAKDNVAKSIVTGNRSDTVVVPRSVRKKGIDLRESLKPKREAIVKSTGVGGANGAKEQHSSVLKKATGIKFSLKSKEERLKNVALPSVGKGASCSVSNGNKENEPGLGNRAKSGGISVQASTPLQSRKPPLNGAKVKSGQKIQSNQKQKDVVQPQPTMKRVSEGSGASRETIEPVRIVALVTATTAIRKMVSSLGGSLIENIEDAATATHVIAADVGNSLRRTPKLMIALSSTSNIVSTEWLTQSYKQKRWQPTGHYLLISDHEAEQKYRFSMRRTLQEGIERRNEGGLLAGWRVVFCPLVAGNKAPSEEELELIVSSAGGIVVPLSGLPINEGDAAKVVVITSDPPLPEQISESRVRSAAENGVGFFTTSWLFDSIMHQKLTGIKRGL